jgi:serine/threonine protein kinase
MDRAKCDLYTLLLKPTEQLPELGEQMLPLAARIAIACRVAEGMQRLHEIGLIHRDLKALPHARPAHFHRLKTSCSVMISCQ